MNQVNQGVRGITLIELLVVIAISSIMLVMGIAYFRGYQRGLALEAQANVLAGALRQVQLFAYTGKLNAGTRPGGHGVRFSSPSEYFVFADAATGGTLLEYDASDSVTERLALSGGFTLQKVLGGGSLAPITGLDIVFAVPHGPVFVDGVTPSPDQRMRITDTQTNNTIDIIVNGISGQVEIN